MIPDPIFPPQRNIDDFQDWVFAMPFPQSPKLPVLALLLMDLGGESGEVIEPLKKHLRDGTPVDIPQITKELGDVVVVIARIATELGLTMSEVLAISRGKFEGRMARGTLRGAGDSR
jgi:NTP pyrophosphatase (non-canonical NTP hydrolase)